MEIPEIDVDALAEIIDEAAAGGAAVRLVDVREPDEFDEAHVPGAVSVPLATVPDDLAAFEGTTYVICQAGGRSLRACEFAVAQGLDGVVNVAGGTGAWIRSGRPTAGGGR